MIVEVTHSLGNLSSALADYQRLSGKTREDVLQKQSAKLAREIHFSLRAIAPNRAALRSMLEARIKSGKMIKIRDRVRQKVTKAWEAKLQKQQQREESRFWGDQTPGKLNWKWKLQQRMVRAEIGTRVSGVGIMGLTTKYPSSKGQQVKALNKYGAVLSSLGIKVTTEGGRAQILWPDDTEGGQRINEGLKRRRPMGAVKVAIESVRQDILVYVRKKQKQLMEQSVRRMTGIARAALT